MLCVGTTLINIYILKYHKIDLKVSSVIPSRHPSLYVYKYILYYNLV